MNVPKKYLSYTIADRDLCHIPLKVLARVTYTCYNNY